jgi:hypothetical protein
MITIYRKDGTPYRVPQSMIPALLETGNYSTQYKKAESAPTPKKKYTPPVKKEEGSE